MKKKELLSPVGSKEALYQAVQNGCDAVYLSGKSFGARKFAPNFELEEITEAIRYCHLYGVKVYVTVNVLVHDEEIEELLDYIAFLEDNKVDAVIMQDLGMISLVRKNFPSLEIHGSTQLHNHNQESIQLLKKLGVKRAVLAREFTIEEISSLGSDIELEVFIHGALCISYSGQCLFSSLVMNRSGNRGECAGLCRLPYELFRGSEKIRTEGDYLLSPKEFNSSSDIKALLDLNQVTSLKIEGRMKSPEYVGFITSFYREILDAYEEGREPFLTEETRKNLKVLYNREFTKGHLFHDTKSDLMNASSPNHIGILLGDVIEVTPKKIKVRLTEDLQQGDGIRFTNEEGMIVNFLYNQRDQLISSASKNEIIYLDNKVGLTELGPIRKTKSELLLKSLTLKNTRKVNISGSCKAIPGEKLVLVVTDGIVTITKEGSIIESAATSPTSKERIEEQLRKIKDTAFTWDKLEIISENAFVPIKELNELRRLAIADLTEDRESRAPSRKEVPYIEETVSVTREKTISALVRNIEQRDAALESGVDRVYVTEEDLYQEDNPKLFLRTSRVGAKTKKEKATRLLLGDVGSTLLYPNTTKITDYYCNAYNARTVFFLEGQDVSTVTLSVELTTEEIISCMKSYEETYQHLPSVEVVIYGRLELMVMKHCILSTHIQKEGPCTLCQKENLYYLKDRNKEYYPILTNCPYTHIFHYKKENRFKDIPLLLESNVNSYRLEFFDETKEEVEEMIEKLKELLKKETD